MVDCITKELAMRSVYLTCSAYLNEAEPIESIYFGGGTPSLLEEKHLAKIYDTILKNYSLSDNVEYTIEANPDDISVEKLQIWKKQCCNRLSIGVQSFDDDELKMMGRIHDAREASDCISLAQDFGFDKLSIDLIYGLPHKNHALWYRNLEVALATQVEHISAYCLTVEERTLLYKKGFEEASDDFQQEQMRILYEETQKQGFEVYEISNLAKNQAYARHNTNYWFQKSYLGVGPSAHSYNVHSRRRNVPNNAAYIRAVQKGEVFWETEKLSKTQMINEYLMTSLRTQWGFNKKIALKRYGYDIEKSFGSLIQSYVQSGYMLDSEDSLRLSLEGKFIADSIILDFWA